MSGSFPLGVSTIRNCSDSDWDCLTKSRLAWPDVALGDINIGLFLFVFQGTTNPKMGLLLNLLSKFAHLNKICYFPPIVKCAKPPKHPIDNCTNDILAMRQEKSYEFKLCNKSIMLDQ